jgi:hypothetical protein
MINIVREGTKIISYGIIKYKITGNQTLVTKYKKPWPVDNNENPLPKSLCYWDSSGNEVKAKTPTMLQADIDNRENEELKKKSDIIYSLIVDCNDFTEFKNKIIGLSG